MSCYLLMLKDILYANSGGYGTLEELLEVITWAQLGIHDKPVFHAASSNSIKQLFHCR